MKATGTGGAPRWRTKNKEVAVKPKFAMHDVKNEVFFCLQVPALVQNINQ